MQFSLFPNDLARAICWTLIHSLWQGMLLAIVTGMVMLLTRRSLPQKRYLILVSLFLLFVITAAITFIRELNSVPPATQGTAAGEHFVYQPSVPVQWQQPADAAPAEHVPPLQRFMDYFNRNAAMVVLVWFIIFSARLIQLGASLIYVRRLRSYKTKQADERWVLLLKQLSERLHINSTIRLLESGILKVPVTIGMLKPVILLPLGMLSHLPMHEMEAILLHELAHIRRRDYFVNLLQSFTETIFFFNPALLWLSAMIREEREHCCDELAISITHNKTHFINALISFQEYHFAGQRYGMAFPGQKNQLLNRVKRIVHNKNKTLNTMEKSILTFALTAFLLFSFVSAKKTTVPATIQDAAAKISPDKSINTQAETTHHNQKSAAAQSQAETFSADTVIYNQEVHAKEAVSAEAVVYDRETPLQETAALPKLNGLSPLTVTLSPVAPLQAMDTLPEHADHFSATVNDDGKTKTEEFTTRLKDGKEYRIKKLNGELKELSVDGKQIPASEFGNYKQEISTIEDMYARKRAEARQRREEAMVRRKEADKRRVEVLASKRKMLSEKRVLEAEKRKTEIKKRHMLQERQHGRMDSKRMLEIKERRLRNDSIHLRMQERQLELRKKQLDKQKEHLKAIEKDSVRLADVVLDKQVALKLEKISLKTNKDSLYKPVKLKLKSASSEKPIQPIIPAGQSRGGKPPVAA
jgi:beta-lactamase regulating signal transducer with metallopeptidase domain